MAIYDEIREQQKKAAEMSLKGKFNYFWDYYKVHTCVTLVTIVLLIFLVKDILTGNQESVFQIAIVNSETQTLDETYEKTFGEYIGINPKKESVTIDNTYQIDTDSADQLTVASTQKMVANVQLGLIDAMLVPEDIVDYYASNSFLGDISKVLPAEQFDKLDQQGSIYYAKTEEGMIPVGIQVEDSPWIKNTNLYSKQKPILTCLINSKHPENILKFIEYIYQE